MEGGRSNLGEIGRQRDFAQGRAPDKGLISNHGEFGRQHHLVQERDLAQGRARVEGGPSNLSQVGRQPVASAVAVASGAWLAQPRARRFAGPDGRSLPRALRRSDGRPLPRARRSSARAPPHRRTAPQQQHLKRPLCAAASPRPPRRRRRRHRRCRCCRKQIAGRSRQPPIAWGWWSARGRGQRGFAGAGRRATLPAPAVSTPSPPGIETRSPSSPYLCRRCSVAEYLSTELERPGPMCGGWVQPHAGRN